MTIKEASERYQIPIEVLQEYERWNLCNKARSETGIWEYYDDDLKLLGMITTLYDIGFNNNEIEHYMRLYLKGDETEAARMQILKQKRKQTLDEIHVQEKRLEYLDYMRFKTQKNRFYSL